MGRSPLSFAGAVHLVLGLFSPLGLIRLFRRRRSLITELVDGPTVMTMIWMLGLVAKLRTSPKRSESYWKNS